MTNASSGSEEFWNVYDFSRRYRLDSKEQNRLLMLYGPLAPARSLLANARRDSFAPDGPHEFHSQPREAVHG